MVQEIGKLTRQIDYILPSHVRRKGNALTYNLANWGSSHAGRTLDTNEEELLQMEEMANLVKILEHERGTPDRGVT